MCVSAEMSTRELVNPEEGAESNFVPSPRVFVGSSGTTTCRRSGGGYEEFFGGQVVCPTCRGAGRIPREMDQGMIALIPISDKRLRPRRTLLYVLLAVVICIITAGLLLFFFFPRAVSLSSNQDKLTPSFIYINVTEGIMLLTVTNVFNITNQNYFGVTVSSLEVSMHYDKYFLATVTNTTVVSLPLRARDKLYITMNATFTNDQDFIVQACHLLPHMMLLIPFRATATIEYLGKSEQSLLNTYQYVHCNADKHYII